MTLDTFTILGIAVLHDTFGFGRIRCQRFMDGMDKGAEYLADGHGRLAFWRENDWKKSNGQKIRNKDLWEVLEKKFRNHAVRFRVESMLPYTESPPI